MEYNERNKDMLIFVGLGNPDPDLEGTRHNIGRDVLKAFAKAQGFSEWQEKGKFNAEVSEGKVGKEKITLVLPTVYMNQSGGTVQKFITSAKKAESLVLVHDDLDRALGKINLNYNKNSGGHKGVESVIKKIKTKNFGRLRLGISKATPKGVVRKPKGEEAVTKYVLGKWSKGEEKELKKSLKTAVEALEIIAKEGRMLAMNKVN